MHKNLSKTEKIKIHALKRFTQGSKLRQQEEFCLHISLQPQNYK